MATTSVGKIMPPKWVVVLAGLILIAVRFAYTSSFLWCMCLLGILGVETIRKGSSAIAGGVVSIPDHYYVAAVMLSLFFMGFFQLLKTAMTTGLFSFREYQQEETKEKGGTE
jgi:hypothetical protein